MIDKSKFKVNVGKKSKINIEWSDKPHNYSHERKQHIKSIVSNRYSIPKDSVSVDFIPIKYNSKGEIIDISTEIINNINEPGYQLKLFLDYIRENNIADVDFDYIKEIDAKNNSKIDYDVYEKYRQYDIEWIEWSNFLSYGKGNRFDFKHLNGLTLVNGEPANMSGKSSFTIDLISFLLFGKTQKPYTLSECFNKYIDDKNFNVSGCIRINENRYIIERVVSRSKKRNGEWGDASQTVKYYELVNSEKEELIDSTKNESGEHSIKTNKIIKESIGSEKDFNMIISATTNDLDSLIDVGSTERGRLLSKWIGLSPIEEKEKVAKEEFKTFEKSLKSKLYNEADVLIEIENLKKTITNNETLLSQTEISLSELEVLIKDTETEKDTLLISKKTIDESIVKLDINTVQNKMDNIERNANIKKQELEKHKNSFELVKDIAFDNNLYKELLNEDKNISIQINSLKYKINTLKDTNTNLIKSETCPTCHRKYDGHDNSKTIENNNKEIEKLINEGISLKEKLDSNKASIIKMEEDRDRYDEKLKLMNLIEIIPIQIQNLRNEYVEQKNLIKNYNENKEFIDLNNRLDISITNVKSKLQNYNEIKRNKLQDIFIAKKIIAESKSQISLKETLVQQIIDENRKLKNWQLYLEMVGKNGIIKMILKSTLPLINAELSRILNDVCDFDIEVCLTDKNDVIFKIIKDGVSSNLAGASGFERTASALALRCVLGGISTMPKPNFITLDEILGKVARYNYDNMRNLFLKIEKNYQFILHICHIEEIKDWHKNIISIDMKNNISSLKSTIQ